MCVNCVVDHANFIASFAESYVATVTASNWTPLFNTATAVITDGGGTLSHAQVAGREFGIPVVSGTADGTKKLKTGMRVKVDGDLGVVYILE